MTDNVIDPIIGGDDDTDLAVDLDPTTAAKRRRFHEEVAPKLAEATGITTPSINASFEKFAYFSDERRFVVVAGAQEKHEVARALARGLGMRGDRRLVLVLPEANTFATMQRAPWLSADAQVEVWTYGKGPPQRQTLRTQLQTKNALLDRLKGQEPETELLASTTAKHLGQQTMPMHNLVEWATSHGGLDPSHLKDERSWHCMGQKVLSIKGTRAGPAVRAGIHYSGAKAPKPVNVTAAEPLTAAKLAAVKAAVESAIALRLDGDDVQIHKADEHWLQAVIRRDPKLVGVEQPALREFPAWRPRDDAKKWGRGFIDLMGVDGHGNIRIVETKVAKNADEMLILQGLDYYVWAEVYAKEVRRRLAASKRARFEIHYVVGDSAGGVYVSPHAPGQVSSLEGIIPWRFHTIKGWYGHPDTTPRATATPLDEAELPPVKGETP